MVTDRIARADAYAGLGPRFKQAFDYLRRIDAATIATGTYEIDGRRVYAIVQEYQTRRPADGRWEAHRKYIDLQYIVKGTERMGYAPAGKLKAGAYDEAKDFEAVIGEGEFLTLSGGEFMLLWPGEAHEPGIASGEPAPVRKIVVKIAVE